MRIIRLTAENIKRLRAVEIEPTGDVVLVEGKNGQGKTSVLDAIWFALGGQGAQKSTARPVRDGEDHAEVTLDLGDIVVTRTWTVDNRSTLTVTGKDGARFASPQSMLDDLVGRLSFDPLAFAQLPEKEQLRVLLDLIELPFNPDELEAQRRGVFDRRTEVNRSVKQLQAELKAVPKVPASTPDEEVSANDVLTNIRNAEAWQVTARSRRSAVEELTTRAAGLREELELVERALAAAEHGLAELPNPLPDPETWTAQLEQLEDTNRWVRVKLNRQRVVDALNAVEKDSERLTAELATIDQSKAEAIQNAVMPIKGLGFDEDGVTYQSVPFKQASSAEQLRVSVAMAMALNPKVRVIRITDGSLLDSDNLAVIQEMAHQQDYQVWVERVTDGDGVGVVIEDGQVKNA